MFWDDLVRHWRREHRAVDPRDLSAAGGHVAVLPARQRRRSRLPWLLIALAIIGAAAFIVMSGTPTEATLSLLA